MAKLLNRIPELMARKDIRDNKRYSQRDMARGTGLSDNAISRLMRYETLNNASFAHMLAIADWLGIQDLRELVKVVDDNDVETNQE
jgi:transcriptional regulator with XRE-family HTH domain